MAERTAETRLLETLRQAMRLSGVSQVEMARRTGYTPKHVNQVLRGHVRLSLALAEEFAQALGCSVVAWVVINPESEPSPEVSCG